MDCSGKEIVPMGYDWTVSITQCTKEQMEQAIKQEVESKTKLLVHGFYRRIMKRISLTETRRSFTYCHLSLWLLTMIMQFLGSLLYETFVPMEGVDYEVGTSTNKIKMNINLPLPLTWLGICTFNKDLWKIYNDQHNQYCTKPIYLWSQLCSTCAAVNPHHRQRKSMYQWNFIIKSFQRQIEICFIGTSKAGTKSYAFGIRMRHHEIHNHLEKIFEIEKYMNHEEDHGAGSMIQRNDFRIVRKYNNETKVQLLMTGDCFYFCILGKAINCTEFVSRYPCVWKYGCDENNQMDGTEIEYSLYVTLWDANDNILLTNFKNIH